MRKKVIVVFGLSGLLLNSGCAAFKKIDQNLEKFSVRLEERRARHPDSILLRQGYVSYIGDADIQPVQTFAVTNVEKIVKFSYNAPEKVNIKETYLVLSSEFRDVLGEPFYEERQRVYPAGFVLEKSTNGTVMSYTFKDTDIEPGRYLYEWIEESPTNVGKGLLRSISQAFSPKRRTLMKGYYQH
jgi:hypothetical protein